MLLQPIPFKVGSSRPDIASFRLPFLRCSGSASQAEEKCDLSALWVSEIADGFCLFVCHWVEQLDRKAIGESKVGTYS